jgi:Clp amino terminal domain, pathogenicity island component
VFERFTDRARSVLVLAQEEARLLNHSFIGTEHILLGLIHQGDGVAGQALESLGITLEAVRNRVEETIGMAGTIPGGSPPFTPRAKKVLELSLREALQLGHSYIGTEHILLGLVREGEGVAATVLVGLGADLGRVRQTVIGLMPGHEEDNVEDAESTGSMSSEYSSSSPQPRCPQCRIALADGARFRTIEVPSDSGDSDSEAISIDVVYCTHCGMTLHMLRSDHGSAIQSSRHGVVPGLGASRLSQPLPQRRGSPRIEQTGPPPEDEGAARDAIARAFGDMGEVDEESGNIPSVEGSEGLAICREQATELARTRFGGQVPDVSVEFVVDSVQFLNDHEAVVTYTAQIRGSLNITLANRPGRAIMVEGEWKVTRETFCEWALVGGVRCPPRADR